jgi:predicted O-methyltransferase YrrM
MTPALAVLLEELERFGRDNDAATSERPRRMLNITRDTGEFLAVLVKALRASRVLEIGTSNGYSTLWLAAAGAHVTTVERSAYKAELARENFRRSGLEHCIRLLVCDAAEALKTTETESCDLVFLDSERSEYAGWWPDVKRVLRPGGLLVVDNATSHAGELHGFISLVKAEADFATALVPVGNGEFLGVKNAR